MQLSVFAIQAASDSMKAFVSKANSSKRLE
jgi:hypothetical protein